MACSLDAEDDLSAIRVWLQARASNPNTQASYRKEAERYLLWCLLEAPHGALLREGGRRGALPALARGARPHRREGMDAAVAHPQSRWIGPKNMPRTSPAWRPFNGPLSATSRRNAVVVVRQLHNFLKNTGYLIFQPLRPGESQGPALKGEAEPRRLLRTACSPTSSGPRSSPASTISPKDGRASA